MKDYYLVFQCDNWKSFSSMRLLAVTYSKEKLEMIVRKHLLKFPITVHSGIDWRNDSIKELNEKIDNMFFEVRHDG